MPPDMGRMVEIANALAASLDRPLSWVHMPCARERADAEFVAPLRDLRLHAGDRAVSRRPPPGRADEDDERGGGSTLAHEFGERLRRRDAVRLGTAAAPAAAGARGGARAHCSRPRRRPVPAARLRLRLAGRLRAHPGRGLGRAARRRLRPPLRHRREPRLVPEPRPDGRAARARTCDEGDVLIDYSGGTGILLDRLRLRVFDRQVGMVIVDSSPKFLRVALERFRGDERVAFRRLALPEGRERLQYVDEVLGAGVPRRRRRSSRRTRSTSTTTSRARCAPGRACSSPAAACGSTPATCATRARARTSGSSTRRCTSSTRSRPGSCARIRAGRRTATCSTTRSGWSAYLAWRDRVFLAPRPLDHYLDALRARRLLDRRGDRADDRGARSTSGTSSSPRTPMPCSAGSAGRRRSTASPRPTRRRPTGSACSASR